MPEPIIKIEGLSKCYIIGHETRERYTALRDVVAKKAKAAADRIRDPRAAAARRASSKEEFRALDDINLDIMPGEKLGVIGRNGAGKSTLLKVLSRITEPTRGRITLHGRVASLLEVGTGFHPELTGRENIFLNGAILGMAKTEIARKFDEIVAFSEVERFLDTPVKRYSSGMYVRLAFAVAAHLEPEILLIDEVLAVGDAEFQKKCLGKMEDVSSQQGRTVLFVSHNMAAIKALCDKCVLLSGGKVAYHGDTPEAIQRYMASPVDRGHGLSIADKKRPAQASLRAKIVDLLVRSEDIDNPEYIDSMKPFTVTMTVRSETDGVRLAPQVVISDSMETLIWMDAAVMGNRYYTLNRGETEITCRIGPTNLFAGEYRIGLVLGLPGTETIDNVADAYSFTVREMDPGGTGFNLQRSYGLGIYHVEHQWE